MDTRRLVMVSLFGMLLVTGCEPMVDNRGHTTNEEDFKQIIAGQSRADDVKALLGTPTTTSNFGAETWYYITERKETSGIWAPEVADQNVAAIEFTPDGVVKNVETYDKAAGKNVQIVDKETTTEGHKLTLMEQLLGNLGRFTAPGRQIDPRSFGH